MTTGIEKASKPSVTDIAPRAELRRPEKGTYTHTYVIGTVRLKLGQRQTLHDLVGRAAALSVDVNAADGGGEEVDESSCCLTATSENCSLLPIGCCPEVLVELALLVIHRDGHHRPELLLRVHAHVSGDGVQHGGCHQAAPAAAVYDTPAALVEHSSAFSSGVCDQALQIIDL